MNGESCTCVYQQQKTSKQSSENTADIVPTGVYRQRKTSKLSAANTADVVPTGDINSNLDFWGEFSAL